jgi:transposase, IS30 family
MSAHEQLTIDTGTTIYFAHLGSPWERGTNENTHGLLRQYFPKGTECDHFSSREIKRVQRELNDRPRAVRHWQKSMEVSNHLVALKS